MLAFTQTVFLNSVFTVLSLFSNSVLLKYILCSFFEFFFRKGFEDWCQTGASEKLTSVNRPAHHHHHHSHGTAEYAILLTYFLRMLSIWRLFVHNKWNIQDIKKLNSIKTCNKYTHLFNCPIISPFLLKLNSMMRIR